MSDSAEYNRGYQKGRTKADAALAARIKEVETELATTRALPITDELKGGDANATG